MQNVQQAELTEFKESYYNLNKQKNLDLERTMNELEKLFSGKQNKKSKKKPVKSMPKCRM